MTEMSGNMPTNKIAANYRTKKPRKAKCDTNSDKRFLAYSKFLMNGEVDECNKLRDEWQEDREFMSKVSNLERVWLSRMAVYVREIQIVRRERDGYRNLVRGFEDTKGTKSRVKKTKRGRDMLDQAEVARLKYPEELADVPLLFSGVS
jgi:hypothetical protein